MVAGIDRLSGYREALADAALPFNTSLVATADFTHEGGVAAMDRLLAGRPDLDAVFCASDLMAAGALAARDAGGRGPRGRRRRRLRRLPIAATSRPPLTSVRQPIEEMGRGDGPASCSTSSDHNDRVARRVVLATELIVRASSRGRVAP